MNRHGINLPTDFKSVTSANSITPAYNKLLMTESLSTPNELAFDDAEPINCAKGNPFNFIVTVKVKVININKIDLWGW